MLLAQDVEIHELHQLAFFIENGILPGESTFIMKRLREYADSDNSEIRLELAKLLAHSPSLPKDIALKLGRDLCEISLIMLRNYPKFDNAELIDLIGSDTKSDIKMRAIVERKHLSSQIADYICEHSNISTILSLFHKHYSHIRLESAATALNRFASDPGIGKLLPEVKSNFARLIEVVNEEAKTKLVSFYNLNSELFTQFSPLDITRLTSENIGKAEAEFNLRQNVDILFTKNQLSHIVILQMLCKADLYSFIYSLSKHSDLPFLNIKDILLSNDEGEITELLTTTGMPHSLAIAVVNLLNIILTGLTDKAISHENYGIYINEKLYEKSIHNNPEIKYIISLMSNKPR
jgi:uncharacterized protein (DUF2336 family)